jgi:hypothetical protein
MHETSIGGIATTLTIVSFILILVSIATAIWKFNSLKSEKDINGSMVYLSGIMYGVLISVGTFLAIIGLVLRILAVIVAHTIDPTFSTFNL